MGQDQIDQRRRQMGLSVQSWTAQGGVSEIGDGYWALLIGPPSPDANMALVSSPNPAARERALDLISTAGVPALVLLAGDAISVGLPKPWSLAGTMPFMARDLGELVDAEDPRVRPATAADAPALLSLMSEAYGIEEAIAAGCVQAGLGQPGLTMWLLEHHGEPVSLVMGARVEDVVSIWCMSTPSRFGRQGFGLAVLNHALTAAKRDGAQVGLLGATPAGKPLYDRTGWHTLEDWLVFVSSESAQFS